MQSFESRRAEWVVRANQDRVLIDVKKGAPTRLFDAMRAAPLLGEIEFDVTAKAGSKKITTLEQARRIINPFRSD